MKCLEICAADLQGVKTAIAGGAGRIELCSGLAEGGLTPSKALISRACRLGIPVNVLIRPRGGDFVYDEDELSIMEEDIREAIGLDASGIVIGVVNPDATVNIEACRRLVQAAVEENPKTDLTFHRAFDIVRHPFESLEEIISLGFRRILTSGQASSAIEGSSLIRQLHDRANGRILIMAGAGVSPANLHQLIIESGADEFHGSARTLISSAMLQTTSSATMGSAEAADGGRLATDLKVVRRMADIIKEYNI